MEGASWVIVDLVDDNKSIETFDRATAEKASGMPRYKVVPIVEWLSSLSK